MRFMGPRRINIAGNRIPDYTANPVVRRMVRLNGSIDGAGLINYNITNDKIISSEAAGYGFSSGRYHFIRIIEIRAYLTSPQLSPITPIDYAVVVTLGSSAAGTENQPETSFSSVAVPGATVASVGVMLPMSSAILWTPYTDTDVVAHITTFPILGDRVVLPIIVDVLCDFN
jgi:hypothetical protein